MLDIVLTSLLKIHNLCINIHREWVHTAVGLGSIHSYNTFPIISLILPTLITPYIYLLRLFSHSVFSHPSRCQNPHISSIWHYFHAILMMIMLSWCECVETQTCSFHLVQHTYNWGFADWGDYTSHPHLISTPPSRPHRTSSFECHLQHIIPRWMRKRRAFKIISWLLNHGITWLVGLDRLQSGRLQAAGLFANVECLHYHAVVERCTNKSRDCDSFTLPAAACERIVGALAHQPSLGGVATSGAAVKGI